MQNFSNGGLPRYDDEMISEMVKEIRRIADRAGSGGMRIRFDWLCATLDADEELTRRVLERAGFAPPKSEEWSTGRGRARLADHGFPDLLADNLTDILDRYDPA